MWPYDNISVPSLPYQWTPEQQAIVNRILSGREDFTFGPGSPNPTYEDLNTFVGGRYSPAGGFAVNRGVALAPSEYNLFSPEQRRSLGIMDIAPANQVGQIERYYGGSGYQNTPSYLVNSQPSVPSEYKFGTGSNPTQMGTIGDYANALQSQQQWAGVGSAISNAFSNLGRSYAQSTPQFNPMSLLNTRTHPLQPVSNQIVQVPLPQQPLDLAAIGQLLSQYLM